VLLFWKGMASAVMRIREDRVLRSVDAGPTRTFVGYCAEEPDSLAGAYLGADGSLRACVFRAQQAKGTYATASVNNRKISTDWTVQPTTKLEVIELATVPQSTGKSLQDASFVKSNTDARRETLRQFDIGSHLRISRAPLSAAVRATSSKAKQTSGTG